MDSFSCRPVLGMEAHFTKSDQARALSHKATGSLSKSKKHSTGDWNQYRESVTLQADVRATALRIKKLQRWHFNPRGRFVTTWDMVVLLALWFVSFVTPVEVCFWDASDVLKNSSTLAVFNRIVDFIFIADIAITFFVPFRASRAQGGLLVSDNAKIARHYLKGWFAVDLITSLPMDDIARFVVELSPSPPDVREFRIFKMLRLLKLIRIVRASRIISRWQDRIAISWGLFSLIKFATLVTVLGHWLACMWGYAGSRDAEYDWHQPWMGYDTGQSWRQKAGIAPTAHASELYIIALYVALNNIFGGSCEITPACYLEFACQTLMIFVGSSVWAYVLGSASGLKATADPTAIAHNQTMDELNLFCREMQLPPDLQVRLREYFRSSLPHLRSTSYDRLLGRMSTRLRGDTVLRACEFRLRAVPFLVHPKLEPEFMSYLASRFQHGVFARLDRISCVDLFILDRGVAAKHGKLGLTGACFGRDIILSNSILRDVGDAIALTFVQTTRLGRNDIFELLPDYPQACVVIRRAALRMAFTRALVMSARIARRARSHSRSVLQAYGLREIFDLAMLEAKEAQAFTTEQAREKQSAASGAFLPMTTKEKELATSMLRRVGGEDQGEVQNKSKWTWAKKSKPPPPVHDALIVEAPKAPTLEESVVALRLRMDESETRMREHVHESEARIVGRINALEGLLRSLRSSDSSASRDQHMGPQQHAGLSFTSTSDGSPRPDSPRPEMHPGKQSTDGGANGRRLTTSPNSSFHQVRRKRRANMAPRAPGTAGVATSFKAATAAPETGAQQAEREELRETMRETDNADSQVNDCSSPFAA